MLAFPPSYEKILYELLQLIISIACKYTKQVN